MTHDENPNDFSQYTSSENTGSEIINPENDVTRFIENEQDELEETSLQDRPLESGLLFGEHRNYRLERKLGEGGMGQAWLATEIEGGREIRTVVCKILPRPVQEDGPEMKQIAAVFKLTQELKHENICLLRGMKCDPDYGWFFVMDYADGESLYTWFSHQPNSEHGVALEVLLPILEPLANALDYAHANGVIHRDIKPQNVMFATKNGVQIPWLVDFGIAARVHQTATMTMGTGRASQGTPSFMAPEQLMGDAQDGRTDQYSLAVMTYLLLSGRLPFTGVEIALIAQILNKQPALIPNQPDWVNAALQKALCKDKNARFAFCTDFVQALRGNYSGSLETVPAAYSTAGMNSPIAFNGQSGTAAAKPIAADAELPEFSWKAFRKIQEPMVHEYLQQRAAYLKYQANYLPDSPKIRKTSARLQEIWSRLFASCKEATVQRNAELRQMQQDGCRPDSPLMKQTLEDVKQLEQEQNALVSCTSIEELLQGIAFFEWNAEVKRVMEAEAEEQQRREAEERERRLAQKKALLEEKRRLAEEEERRREQQKMLAWEETIRQDSRNNVAGTHRTVTVNDVEYAFCWCPSGKFQMGSIPSFLGLGGESDRNSDEFPHMVVLSEGFWMLQTLVTQAMWQSVMGGNPSKFKGPNLPVERVSWTEAQDFCKLLVIPGLKLQLPTEAQWEYACRAGTTTAHAVREMWCKGNSDDKTHSVGQKQANAWGLFDMHGNVNEWCLDCYQPYPQTQVEDPVCLDLGTHRVARGGSWNDNPEECRSACRHYSVPNCHSSTLGFRFVATLAEKVPSMKKSAPNGSLTDN